MTRPDEPEPAGEPPSANWRAHAAVFSATLGAFCNLYSMQALLPLVQSKFGVGVTFATSLLTVTTLGLAISSPMAGRVGARIGAKAAVITALLALAYSTLAIGLVYDSSWLLFWRIAQGLLIPIGLSAILANTTLLWPQVSPASLAATYTTGVILGGLLGRFLPASLASFGWTSAFVGFAFVQLALAAIVLWLFPRAATSITPVREPVLKWLQGIGQVLRKDIPHLAIGGFLLMFTQSAITTYIAIRLAGEPFFWSTQALGALYVVFLPALVAVRFTPRAIESQGPKTTLRVAIGAAWLGLGLTLFDAKVPILVGMTLFSASVFVVQTVLAYRLGGVAAERREQASSAYIAFYYLGASAGAIAPSVAWGSFGWPGCLALLAFAQLFGLLLAQKRIIGQ